MNYTEDYMRNMLEYWHPDWHRHTIDTFKGQQLTAIYLKSEKKYGPKKRSGVSTEYMIEKMLEWNPNTTLEQYMIYTGDQIHDMYRKQSAEIVEQMMAAYS
ncbi:hypothetical protein ABGV42_01675 [Paenibacillus pabuli]|uniref:hypothetical protein n=1 Tax=Paenibacillus pabuli TaxID=1472 RepID=UPI0032420678